jgi:hypothetical protein
MKIIIIINIKKFIQKIIINNNSIKNYKKLKYKVLSILIFKYNL